MKCPGCGYDVVPSGARFCPNCGNLLPAAPVIDFSVYIAKQTKDFTGREWVFQRINDWLRDPDEARVFLLTGEPGCGKTAIAARLAQFSWDMEAPPGGLGNLAPGFLSAVHFCSARDRYWINPHVFVESVAQQLSARYPTYASVLIKKSVDQNIHIEVHQSAQVVSGQQVGAVIQLDTSGISPEDAFISLVREPLEDFCGAKPDEQMVILVDALDESLLYSGEVDIVSLLAQAGELPEGVRLVLTSRQDERVENEFLDAGGLLLSAPEFTERNQEDARSYIKIRFNHDERLAARVAEIPPEQVQVSVAEITKTGNLHYIGSLLDSIARGQRSLTELEGLPEELDGWYYETLDRIVKLGKNDWTTDYAPLMGVLSVAQSSLSPAQLETFTGQTEEVVWERLGDLQQLIEGIELGAEQEEGQFRYQLYHPSVVSFLRRPFLRTKKRRLRNSYYLPAKTWHRRIADYYWETYRHDWRACDDYGLNNLATHLFEIDSLSRLRALISKEWMHARSFEGFTADARLAWPDDDARIGYFRQAVQVDPEWQGAHEVLASLLHTSAMQDIGRGDLETAATKLAEARAAAEHTDPLDARVLNLRGYIAKTLAFVAQHRGNKADGQKYYQEAALMFEQVLRLKPDNASALLGLGNVQYLMENLDAAIAAYSRVTELLPSYTAAWHDLAIAYEYKMRVDPAHDKEWCQKALAAWRRTYHLAPEDAVFSADYLRNIGHRISWLERQCG
jgi:tetratricopeptide (TPR) repeat protein